MAEIPKGATIVKEELNDEAGMKLREARKSSKFSDFIDTMRRKETENAKPLSGDLEVIEDADDKLLAQLQKDKRTLGWDDKTRTALVLKLAFAEKKKKIKEKGE